MFSFYTGDGQIVFQKHSDGVMAHVAGCGCMDEEGDLCLDQQILIEWRHLEELEAWIREARGA